MPNADAILPDKMCPLCTGKQLEDGTTPEPQDPKRRPDEYHFLCLCPGMREAREEQIQLLAESVGLQEGDVRTFLFPVDPTEMVGGCIPSSVQKEACTIGVGAKDMLVAVTECRRAVYRAYQETMAEKGETYRQRKKAWLSNQPPVASVDSSASGEDYEDPPHPPPPAPSQGMGGGGGGDDGEHDASVRETEGTCSSDGPVPSIEEMDDTRSPSSEEGGGGAGAGQGLTMQALGMHDLIGINQRSEGVRLVLEWQLGREPGGTPDGIAQAPEGSRGGSYSHYSRLGDADKFPP